MAAFVKYQQFVEDVAKKVHNLNSDTLKVALTNTAPNVSTHKVLADISEIAAGNGYTAGGNTAAFSSGAQTGGIYKLVLSDPATWTCVTAAMATFRYAVLYNSTAANGPLIGYWDYTQGITLQVGETFVADLNQTDGVLTLE